MNGTRTWRIVAILAVIGYAVAVALLALAVYLQLPGPLAAWNDPTAWLPVAIPVVLGLLAYGAWAWPSRHRDRAFSLVFLAAGTVTVLVLGTAGYLRCIDPDSSAGWSVVARVLGFLLGNYDVGMFSSGECGDGVPLALQFARLAQLTVLFVAASRAVAALLRSQLDRVMVRFARRVTLAVGVDAASAALLPALASDRRSVVPVAVTPDAGAAWVRGARAGGWRIVSGDPADPAVLTPLLTRGRNRHVLTRLAALSADSTAVQRLVAAAEQAVDGRDGPAVRALVRIDDAWQAEDWRRRYLSRAGEWTVDTISIDEVTARIVVEDALQAGVDRIILTGRTGLTFAVLAELAQQGREGELRGEEPMPEVVVLDPRADEVLTQHAFAQQRFGNASGIRASSRAEEATSSTIAAAVEAPPRPACSSRANRMRSPAASPPSSVPSTPNGSSTRVRTASRASAGSRSWRACTRMAARSTRVGARSAPGSGSRAWGTNATSASTPTPTSRRDGRGTRSPFYRASNVRQVLATLAGAVEAGRSWGAGADAAGMPDDAQLEVMAELEHRSWSDHLRQHGWRHAPERDDARRKHPDLLPWEQLDEAAREKTRGGVRGSLELLAMLGYRSFDEPEAGWRTVRRHGVVGEAPRRGLDLDHPDRPDPARFGGRLGGLRQARPGARRRPRGVRGRPPPPRRRPLRARRHGAGAPGTAGRAHRDARGPLRANAGEWVVRGDLDEEWVITAERLASAYESADEPG
ncbi:MAG: RyR domain-containing protein [Schumannella sp.]